MTLKYVFNWKLTAFYLLFLPLLISLGFWQLDRAEEKEGMQSRFEERLAQSPVSPEVLAVENLEQLQYQPVRAYGQFINDRYFLLDNRINEGRAGYEVIMAFRLQGMQSSPDAWTHVWVNRGWVPAGALRSDLPEVEPIELPLQITGLIDTLATKAFVLQEVAPDSSTAWPKVIQRFDAVMQEDSTAEPGRYLPYPLRINSDSPGALETIWQPINMSPSKHIGYATQWFAMAVALTLLYLWASLKRSDAS